MTEPTKEQLDELDRALATGVMGWECKLVTMAVYGDVEREVWPVWHNPSGTPQNRPRPTRNDADMCAVLRKCGELNLAPQVIGPNATLRDGKWATMITDRTKSRGRPCGHISTDLRLTVCIGAAQAFGLQGWWTE